MKELCMIHGCRHLWHLLLIFLDYLLRFHTTLLTHHSNCLHRPRSISFRFPTPPVDPTPVSRPSAYQDIGSSNTPRRPLELR